MALGLYIMRQIEMKMRRVSRNSFRQQHRGGERRRRREEEVGDCGCWCIKGDGSEDTCRDFGDHEPLRHLPNPKVGVSIWGACAK